MGVAVSIKLYLCLYKTGGKQDLTDGPSFLTVGLAGLPKEDKKASMDLATRMIPMFV